MILLQFVATVESMIVLPDVWRLQIVKEHNYLFYTDVSYFTLVYVVPAELTRDSAAVSIA